MADMLVLVTVSVAQRRHYGRHKRKKTQPTTHITRHRHPRPLLPIIIYNQSTMGMGESFIIIGTPTLPFIVPKARMGRENR